MRILLLFLAASTLLAQECEQKSFWSYHPLHVGGNAIFLGPATVDAKNNIGRDGHVVFNKENAFAYFFLPISSCSFFLPRVEWNTFELDWNHNTRFHKTRFEYMQFALTFLSMAEEKWRWVARIDYNVDLHHFSQPREYGLFSALLWGTHEIWEKWHYHVGALGYTGFRGQEVYPIIGLDYAPNSKWFIQAVFPITYSVEYILTDQWRIGLKGRPLKERFRVGSHEPVPRSIFNYSTMGAEFNVHYEKFLRLELEFFAGYNFGGSLYLKDHAGHQALYTNVKGSPYAGLSLNWGI